MSTQLKYVTLILLENNQAVPAEMQSESIRTVSFDRGDIPAFTALLCENQPSEHILVVTGSSAIRTIALALNAEYTDHFIGVLENGRLYADAMSEEMRRLEQTLTDETGKDYFPVRDLTPLVSFADDGSVIIRKPDADGLPLLCKADHQQTAVLADRWRFSSGTFLCALPDRPLSPLSVSLALADRLLSRINSDGRIPQPEEVLLFNEDILVATDGGGDLNTLMLITLFGTTGMPGILNALVACDPLPSLFYTTVEAALLHGRDLTVSCWLNAVQSVLQQPVFMNTKEVVA